MLLPSSAAQRLSRRTLLTRLGGTVAGLLLTSGCTKVDQLTSITTHKTPTPEGGIVPTATTVTPLRVAFTSSPNQFDPARVTTLEAYQVVFAIYDALVWIDQTLTPQPLLAEAWQLSKDRLSWTFQLKRNIKFHNGAHLTSQDVVYTFTRLFDPKLDSSFRAVLSFVKGVEALDDYTVRFHLNTPDAELPFLLGSPQAGIVPNKMSATELAAKPLGAGPFQFVEFIPGDRLTMIRYADYWDAQSTTIQELEFIYLPSFSDQANGLITNKIDLVPDINLQDLGLLANHPEVRLVEVPSGAYQTIIMQATEPPFTDVRVRQALKYCVDRPAMRQTVLQGRGKLGNDEPIAPVSPFWADLPIRNRDLDRARQLLADAGYPDGLQLSLITSSSRPGMMEIATAFRDMARPAGVDIQVIRVPADVYWTDYSGKVPFHIGNWNFRPGVDEALMVAYHSTSQQNESKWSSPQLDKLIEAARVEDDFAKRKAIYREAQALITEEGAVIIPYFRPVLVAMRQEMINFTPHPTGWLDFSDVQIKPST